MVDDHLVICEKDHPQAGLSQEKTAGKTFGSFVLAHRPWSQRSLRIGAGSATVAVLDEKIFKKIGIQSPPRRFILVLIMMAILDHFRVFHPF